eukprot:GHRQ01021254.1.p1 GENE.GHRQ01021254.1~~GHRQ01021254.1.p1  ORF type:complete len:107 (+),score=39.21 GHRQ01021254.1:206-526(+)
MRRDLRLAVHAALGLDPLQAFGSGHCSSSFMMLLQPRTLQAYHSKHGLAAPCSILDVGCSTGISSRWYRRAYPAADITGLDLSPYFLAVAELEERCAAHVPVWFYV